MAKPRFRDLEVPNLLLFRILDPVIPGPEDCGLFQNSYLYDLPCFGWSFRGHSITGAGHTAQHIGVCSHCTRLSVGGFQAWFALVFSTQTFLYELFKVDFVDKLTELPSMRCSFWVIFESLLQFFPLSFPWPLLLPAALSFEDGWLALEQHSVTAGEVTCTHFYGRNLSASWPRTILTKIISTQRLVLSPPLHPTQNHHWFQKPVQGRLFWTESCYDNYLKSHKCEEEMSSLTSAFVHMNIPLS